MSILEDFFAPQFMIAKLIATAVIVGSVGYACVTITHRLDKASAASAIIAQKDADNEACREDEIITKEVNDAFVHNQADANNQCANALRMRATCVPIANTDTGTELAGAQRKPNDTGLTSGWLKSYEVTCKSIQRDYHTAVEFGHRCAVARQRD